ncbi:MAG TPA: L,D-transpeptidase family protein [Mycobacteriales bacterium]|jgi:lipoprotein-anchoring transpeptidase ErfK/SrfK|nr:L,D-transpeptidase family protein [Mycobacteriales bacterium]
MHVRFLRLPGVALAVSLLLAGCSGGGSAPGAAGAQATPTAPPLKVVSVAPLTLSGTTPVVVTFRRPLTNDSPLPTFDPAVPGDWERAGSVATFTPEQAYPPSTTFHLQLARRAGAVPRTIATPVSEPGSLRFANQILARLHYLPLDTKAAPPASPADEAAAVYDPPPGGFSWRYADTPDTIVHDWKPGKPNVVLRGAVIAFQHQHHLRQDGAIGPATWKELLQADLDQAVNPDRYSYVSANLYLPQKLSVWVDGKTELTTAVNGGVAAAPTPLGTYPVYLRYTATTMQGTNPDGTKYKDKGVPWVNYFSGGSAVHGFERTSYGYPQSVGCLELPPSVAKQVYDMIDYGTLVTVAGPYVKPPKVGKPSPPATPNPKHHRHPKPTASPSSTASPELSETPAASSSPSSKPKPT